MVSRPVAIGLTLCDQVIVEEGTRKVSLIGTFSAFRLTEFPSAPQQFCVVAALTDGARDAIMDLIVTRLDTDVDVYARRLVVPFPNRFTEVRVLFRVAQCVFPDRGIYQFTLLADGEWVAQRRVPVKGVEDFE